MKNVVTFLIVWLAVSSAYGWWGHANKSEHRAAMKTILVGALTATVAVGILTAIVALF